MNKYLKKFLIAVGILSLGFISFAAYDIYDHIGIEGVLNLFDFLIHGK